MTAIDPKALSQLLESQLEGSVKVGDAFRRRDIERIAELIIDAADLVERSEILSINEKRYRLEVQRDKALRDVKSLTASIQRCWGKEIKLGKQIAVLQGALQDLLHAAPKPASPSSDIDQQLVRARFNASDALTDTAEAAAQYQRVLKRHVVVPVELQATLQAQHDWHLSQTDEDQWGIIPAEAYAESSLCDRTISALRKAKYAAAPQAGEPVDIRVADLTEDQREYVAKLIEDQEKAYDPTAVIGGPQAGEEPKLCDPVFPYDDLKKENN